MEAPVTRRRGAANETKAFRVWSHDLVLIALSIIMGVLILIFGYLSEVRSSLMALTISDRGTCLFTVLEAIERLRFPKSLQGTRTKGSITGGVYGIMFLPFTILTLNGRGCNWEQLANITSFWFLPSLDCSLLYKGQPDIAGPGITATLIAQTFVCFFAIAVADNVKFVRSVLMTARGTRMVLLVVGFLQSVRREVSYYHLIALSTLHHLLGIPEYFVTIHLITPRVPNESHYVLFERLLNIGGFFLSAMFNLSLAFVSTQLMGVEGRCLSQTADGQLTYTKIPGLYIFWGEGFLNALILFQYIWMDFLLAIYPWLEVRLGCLSQRFTFYRVCFLRDIGLAVFTTMCIMSTVQWLNNVSDPSQSQWSFGQMFALASIGITSLAQWVEYAMDTSAVDPTVTRYFHWCRYCGSPFVMLVRLARRMLKTFWHRTLFIVGKGYKVIVSVNLPRKVTHIFSGGWRFIQNRLWRNQSRRPPVTSAAGIVANIPPLEMDDLRPTVSNTTRNNTRTEGSAWALTLAAQGLNAERVRDRSSPFLPPPSGEVTYAETRIRIPTADS